MAPRLSYTRELDDLQTDLIKMASIVEESLNKSITALVEKSLELCKEVFLAENEVDEYDNIIQKKCINLIARQQPLAKDLRMISSAMKIVTDIERVGDHAYDISEITVRIIKEKPVKLLNDIPIMSNMAKDMFSRAVNSFVNQDIELAKQVCLDDDNVDDYFNKIILELVNMMKNDPSTISAATNFMFIVKYLERIGDHATNIAEWVIFNVTGEHKDMKIL